MIAWARSLSRYFWTSALRLSVNTPIADLFPRLLERHGLRRRERFELYS